MTDTIETICRAICKAKEIDPDRVACPFAPEFIFEAPVFTGFYLPPANMFMPAWKMFEPTVRMTLTALRQIYKNTDEMNEILEAVLAVKQ